MTKTTVSEKLNGKNSLNRITTFTRTLIFNVVGLVIVLELILLAVLVWRDIASTEAAAKLAVQETLDRATERLNILIRAAEMTGESAARAAHSPVLTGVTLRSTLEQSLAAFEQRPELSYVGIVLPETGEYGNLERTANGDILLWLFPGKRTNDLVTRNFILTNKGFVLHEEKPAYDYDPRGRPFYQAALISPPGGRWIPTYQWIVHDGNNVPLWGFSYVKALHDDTGRLVGVLDTDFDIPALNRFLRSLDAEYHSHLQIIELGDTLRVIGGPNVQQAPLPVQAELSALLKFSGDVWIDKVTLNGERHWLGARRMALRGDISWMVIATSPAPLIDASLRSQLYHIGGMGLIIAIGLILISIRMGHRFGKPLVKLEQRVADIGLDEFVESPSITSFAVNEFREIHRLEEAVDNMTVVVNQLIKAKEQISESNEQLELQIELRTNELLKTYDELVSVQRLASLGAMVAGISHELNTPIGNTLLSAATLEMHIETLDQKMQSGSLTKSSFNEFLKTGKELSILITRSTQRAAALIASFKQVAVDQTSERRRQFDLSDLIDDHLAILRLNLSGRQISMENQVQRGVICDSYPGPLGQIIANVIENSILHGFAENESGIIRIFVDILENRLILTLMDNGVGMTPHALAHVFAPFFTTTLGQGGSGLGMSISYNIATAILGGNLSAKSTFGEGAAFILSFPRVAPFPM
jgi:signal transduction histidine kinase